MTLLQDTSPKGQHQISATGASPAQGDGEGAPVLLAFTAATRERWRTGGRRKEPRSSSSCAHQLCGDHSACRQRMPENGALRKLATAGEQTSLHSPAGRSGHRPPIPKQPWQPERVPEPTQTPSQSKGSTYAWGQMYFT